MSNIFTVTIKNIPQGALLQLTRLRQIATQLPMNLIYLFFGRLLVDEQTVNVVDEAESPLRVLGEVVGDAEQVTFSVNSHWSVFGLLFLI